LHKRGGGVSLDDRHLALLCQLTYLLHDRQVHLLDLAQAHAGEKFNLFEGQRSHPLGHAMGHIRLRSFGATIWFRKAAHGTLFPATLAFPDTLTVAAWLNPPLSDSTTHDSRTALSSSST
jgi:hypothetical protein